MSMNTSTSSTVRGVRGCGHCRNLNLPNWNEHNVNKCPELARTMCSDCKKYGHTKRYCALRQNEAAMKIINTPEMQASIKSAVDNVTMISGGNAPVRGITSVCGNISARVNAPPGNAWALAAKKAMTTDDKAVTDSIEAKVKADIAEKKRMEHDAYLERKARRERLELARKDCIDKNFAIFQKHMYYLYGPDWIQYFDEYSDKPIHSEFYEKINALREEDRRLEFYVEQLAAKREIMEAEERRNKAEEFNALKQMKKLSLSPADFKIWCKEARFEKEWHEMEETDIWLYRCSDDYSRGCRMDSMREAEGKIWLEEQLKIGTIKLLENGTYNYRFYRF